MKRSDIHLRCSLAPVIVVAVSLMHTGCTVTDTIYLQEVSVAGPVKQPPVYINADDEPGTFHVSPSLSFANRREIRGHVDQYPPAAAYATSYENLTWTLPSSNVGLDADVCVSRSVSLTFGANMAAANGDNFGGGHAGIGLRFHGEEVSGRLDGGVQCQEIGYSASTVVVREVTSIFSSSTETAYFVDRGSSLLVDYYLSLTLNSKGKNFPLNVFGQIAYSKQSLTNFYPHTETVFNPLFPFITHIVVDTRAASSAGFVMLTPGLYVNLGNSARLLAGVRCAWEIELTGGSSTDVMLLPLVQCDFTL